MKHLWLYAAVLFLTGGCATERYLSAEEDAKMREMCEQPGGCAVLPGQQWRQIEQILQRLQGA